MKVISSERPASDRRSKGLKKSVKHFSKQQAIVPEVSSFLVERRCFLRICESLNTPRSLACFMLVSAQEWGQYLQLSFPDPLSTTFADDYLVTSIFKKHKNLPGFTEEDRVSFSIKAFYEGEDMCRATNSRFEDIDKNPIYSSDIFVDTQKWIARLLGPLNEKVLDQIFAEMRFGPGATSSVAGRDVLLSKKYVASQDVTPRFANFVPSLTEGLWYNPEKLKLVAYNKFVSVPKDAKRNRGICIEPTMNIFAQLGVGTILKDRLARFGLYPSRHASVKDGQARNREMCREALSRDLATIDLSMASDTLAYYPTMMLLPPEWFHLLDLMRVSHTLMPDGTIVKLEKFSSMGNGYTWELETLIFTAICLASGVEIEDLAVFGDDIICPVDKVQTVMDNLEIFGFKVNRSKSYWQGTFRESCGHDYNNGVYVRPFYFKGDYRDTEESVIHVANLVRLYAHRRNHGNGCDIRFLPSWLRTVKYAPRASATGICIGSGDSGLIKNFDEFCPSTLRHGHQGHAGRVLYRAPAIAGDRTDPYGAYLASLHRPTELPRSIEYLRGILRRPQLRNQVIFEWQDIGPWV